MRRHERDALHRSLRDAEGAVSIVALVMGDPRKLSATVVEDACLALLQAGGVG